MSDYSTYQVLERTVNAQHVLPNYKEKLNYAQLQMQFEYWRANLIDKDIITKLKLVDIVGLLAMITFIAPIVNTFSHVYTEGFKSSDFNQLSWSIFIILIIFRYILSKIIYIHQTKEYIFDHVNISKSIDYCNSHGYQSLVSNYSIATSNYNNQKEIAENPTFSNYIIDELDYAYTQANKDVSLNEINLIIHDYRIEKKREEAIYTSIEENKTRIKANNASIKASEAKESYFRQETNRRK